MIPLVYELPKVLTEIESRIVVASGRGEGWKGKYCLLGTESEFFEMKSVSEMGGRASCTTVWTYLMH